MKDQNICHKKRETSSPNRVVVDKNLGAVMKAAVAAEENRQAVQKDAVLAREMKGIELPAVTGMVPRLATPIRNASSAAEKAARTSVTDHRAETLATATPVHPAAGISATNLIRSANSATAAKVVGILNPRGAEISVTDRRAETLVTVMPVHHVTATSVRINPLIKKSVLTVRRRASSVTTKSR